MGSTLLEEMETWSSVGVFPSSGGEDDGLGV